MDFYHQQQTQYSAPSHHESFSSASSGSASSVTYGPFTPVSGRSSPASQRMGSVGSCEFDPTAAAVGAGSFSNVNLGLTPPPTGVASFFGNMAAPPSMAATIQAATSGPDMGNSGYYTTAPSFSQGPATPDRHSSISSNHNSVVTSPTSPANMLGAQYSTTLSPLTSVASSAQSAQHQHAHHQASICSDGGYPFQESQRHHQPQQGAQPRHQNSPPYNMFPTPPPTHHIQNDCGDISPSEFYWHNNPGRQDSPIANMFEDRPASLPLPPPSVTLKSQSAMRDNSTYGSPEDLERRYSMASAPVSPTSIARRRQYVDSAQIKTAALQRHMVVGQQYGGHHHHSQPRYAVDPYGSSAVQSEVGQIVVRNGIQVSKVASGAFKCLFNGCQAHPFKRSEHLKRHVMTHHENKDAFPCEFCGRNFNRKDNWRSHLKLHTVARGKNARTDYFPKAVRVYEEEMRKVSKCRPRKDKMLYRM